MERQGDERGNRCELERHPVDGDVGLGHEVADQDGIGIREDEVAARAEERPDREGKEARDVRPTERRRREIEKTEVKEPGDQNPRNEPTGEAGNPIAEDDRGNLDTYPDQVIDQTADLVDADHPSAVDAI